MQKTREILQKRKKERNERFKKDLEEFIKENEELDKKLPKEPPGFRALAPTDKTRYWENYIQQYRKLKGMRKRPRFQDDDNDDEVRRARQRQYYYHKKKEHAAYQKKYYLANKDYIHLRSRVYQIKNRAAIKERASEHIACECGDLVRRSSITVHRKSKKHNLYMSWIEGARSKLKDKPICYDK